MALEDISLERKTPFRLESMGETALLELRANIDKLLTIKLEDLNLAEELALQFKQAKALYSEVVDDTDTGANQKAAVLNTVNTIIASITKSQAELYSAERLKRIEAATLKALKSLPKKNQEEFMELYVRYLAP